MRIELYIFSLKKTFEKPYFMSSLTRQGGRGLFRSRNGASRLLSLFLSFGVAGGGKPFSGLFSLSLGDFGCIVLYGEVYGVRIIESRINCDQLQKGDPRGEGGR